MGYSEKSKAYRLYDLTTNKVFVSRDVKFDEHSQLTIIITSPILERSEDCIDEDDVCIVDTKESTNAFDQSLSVGSDYEEDVSPARQKTRSVEEIYR